MLNYIKDAILYEGDTRGHAIVGVVFEWGVITILVAFMFFITR